MPGAAQATAPFLDSTREGAVIARSRVDPPWIGPSWIRPKSVAIATVEALSAPTLPNGGGRLLATPQDPGGVAGVKSPTAGGNPLARCAYLGEGASRCAHSLACRALDTRADPFPGRVEEGRGCWGHCGHHSVSLPRSSNRTCGFPASGFPTGFIARHTAVAPGESGAAVAHRIPQTRPYLRTVWCRATAPYDA